MIVYDLACAAHGHRFEGWFASSQDFARQQERGLVACPQCGGTDVIKAPMAPRLARKGNQRGAGVPVPAAPQAMALPQTSAPETSAPQTPAPELPAPMREKLHAALHAMAAAQAEALKSSRWVGRNFVKDARAMHYGDAEAQPIHGQASPEEARALAEEGVAIAPILFPIAPPDEVN